ncbi:hypothetical protein BC828DRAFT_379677 [Blastocladiella britannica]|nr:hypothetical protein BC828DRAFT_379677 [Blastocladiella britannica]
MATKSPSNPPPHPDTLIASGDLCAECAVALELCLSLEHFNAVRATATASTGQQLVPTEKVERQCGFCLGSLGAAESIANAILAEIRDDALEFDCPEFRLELMLPRVVAHRRKQWLDAYKDHGINFAFEVKYAFARRILPMIEASLGRTHSEDAALHFIVEVVHVNDKEVPVRGRRREGEPSLKEIKRIKKANKAPAASRDESLARAIDGVSSPAFPLPPITTPMRITSTRIRRDSIYLGGRYLKLARHVAQSLWLIDGVPKTPHSVEQCCGDGAKAVARADEAVLIAAGREDSDVRMLGSGRPFYIELKNARNTKFDSLPIALEVNRMWEGIVQVSRMRWITKEETKLVKVGEELKAKQYSCLVWADAADPAKIAHVNSLTSIQIQQATPTRVLHRRANMTRPKMVHWVRVTPLAERQFYRVDLETQAGSYVKEFITGDLGRTVPSLRSLLGTSTDILELDVTNVQLEFPPRTEEERVQMLSGKGRDGAGDVKIEGYDVSNE